MATESPALARAWSAAPSSTARPQVLLIAACLGFWLALMVVALAASLGWRLPLY